MTRALPLLIPFLTVVAVLGYGCAFLMGVWS